MRLENYLYVYEDVPTGYYRWMIDRALPHIEEPILEVGSGPGIVTRLLLEYGFGVTGIDIDPVAVERLGDAFGGSSDFTILKTDVETDDLTELRGAPFKTVFCLNVLEHLSDDIRALENMAAALEPGGKLIVFVPAFPWLYGSMDAKVGHRRRYRKQGLEALLERAGFTGSAHYFNLPGIVGWWWRFCVRRAEDFSPLANRLFGHALPIVSAVESRFRPRAGLSLMAIGEKRQC